METGGIPHDIASEGLMPLSVDLADRHSQCAACRESIPEISTTRSRHLAPCGGFPQAVPLLRIQRDVQRGHGLAGHFDAA